jgi:hypothetical protein
MWFLKWLVFGMPVAFLATFGTIYLSEYGMEKRHELTPTNLIIKYHGLKDEYLRINEEKFSIKPEKVDVNWHKDQVWEQDVAIQPNEIDLAYYQLAMDFSREQRNIQFYPLMFGYWFMLAVGGILFYGIKVKQTTSAQ